MVTFVLHFSIILGKTVLLFFPPKLVLITAMSLTVFSHTVLTGSIRILWHVRVYVYLSIASRRGLAENKWVISKYPLHENRWNCQKIKQIRTHFLTNSLVFWNVIGRVKVLGKEGDRELSDFEIRILTFKQVIDGNIS